MVLTVFNEAFLTFTSAGENCFFVDYDLISQRATLLQKYLQDEEKQLQALSALQALMVQMDHPSRESHYSYLYFTLRRPESVSVHNVSFKLL